MTVFFKPHIPGQTLPRMAEADDYGAEKCCPRLPVVSPSVVQDNEKKDDESQPRKIAEG